MNRVIRVPVLDEGVLLGPRATDCGHGTAALPLPSHANCSAHSQGPPPMVFDLEGFELEQPAADGVSESATRTRQTVARLLHPGIEDQPVYSAALMATQAGGGSLEATAQVLARLDFSVKLGSSTGGSLHSLKHTFITATRNTVIAGEPAEWIIDPSFAQAFAVACPTPRYAHIMSAVPPVLVAPLRRVVRAVLVLGAELARCFEKQGIPLPPWRHVDAITSKYDAVSFVPVPVHGSSDDAASPAAVASGTAAPAVAAAAAARKQQRQRQQLEHVQLRLVRLGLLQEQAPSSMAPAWSGSSSNTEAVDSPRSVLEAAAAQSGASPRIVGFAAKGPSHECFCCGWRPTRFQPPRCHEQRPRQSLLGCKLQHCNAAASAA